MEFIKAEEFSGQPVEVQKVFLDWWKCDNGDLYVDKREYKLDKNYCDINCVNINLEGDIEGDWEYFKTISTPIFSEGQLRQFIEDKTGCKLSICLDKLKEYFFKLLNYFTFDGELLNSNEKEYKHLGTNLLQAYW